MRFLCIYKPAKAEGAHPVRGAVSDDRPYRDRDER